MATFHASHPESSVEASRLLHPATQSTPLDHVLGLDVLAEIAAGLARTVRPGSPVERHLLLATPAYEASVEVIGAGACRVIEAAPGLPLSMAVAAGELLVWTTSEGTAILTPGAGCSADGGERIELANVTEDPAVAVVVSALDQGRPDEVAALSPCSSSTPR